MAKLNLTQKIIKKHLVDGIMDPGQEVGIRIDQTLTQDATGTMAYLQYEAMGIPRVKTKLSVSYVDHNMLQAGFENADDHRYLQSVAAKYGVYFSKPGNGICHQVHLERFGRPGMTLLGSDSHTPTNGGIGMLAIGAGGLDVAVAMGGGPFYMTMPRVVGIKLTGKLQPWVTAKDVILEMLRRLTVKGGVGKIMEYYGPGVKTLTVPERSTITNMGAELGATTSIFPSDEMTKRYLTAQARAKDYAPAGPDEGCDYDEHIKINLSELEPLIAQPHSPDNVVKVKDVEGLKVDQVCIGSCTNSSIRDLMVSAAVLKGKTVAPNLSMTVTPGSKQVFEMIAANGALTDIIASGARILESACGPCIGMGQAPPSGGVSVRSFNRNFEGRAGTRDANVYLSSPETAVACAVKGKITDPRKLGKMPPLKIPTKFHIDDRNIMAPAKKPEFVEILRGPNIQPCPVQEPLADTVNAEVLIKLGDNITTDHIMPAGAQVLPLRSNIPKISEYVFYRVDETFPKRAREAKAKGGGVIVGGDNYGQGSSREHAALAPMFLGVKAVLAKTFARIHWANLINFGIPPLVFANAADYDKVEKGDRIEIGDLVSALRGGRNVTVKNATKGIEFAMKYNLSDRQKEILIAGGLLNYTRQQADNAEPKPEKRAKALV
jgi:aconitate hydratase